MQRMTGDVMKPKNLLMEVRPNWDDVIALYETNFAGFESGLVVCKGQCIYCDSPANPM